MKMAFKEAIGYVPSGKDCAKLRNFNFMNDGRPPSVRALAESIGFAVELRDLPNGISGFLEPDTFSEKGFRIVVNGRHGVLRRRWTVLHEIAHYYLHPHHTEPLAGEAYRATQSGTDHFYSLDELTEEREANAWVSAIVFDQRALEAAVSMHGRDRASIARKFGVSMEALEVAIRERL